MKNKSLIFLMLFLLFKIENVKAFENKILFKVENSIITTVDLFNEIKYLKLVNKDLEDLEKTKIYEIAKNSYKTKNKNIEVLKRYKNRF